MMTDPLPLMLQATQEILSRIPVTTTDEFNAAVQSAKDAFPAWRDTSVQTRVRVMFKFQELIRKYEVTAWAHTHEQRYRLSSVQ